MKQSSFFSKKFFQKVVLTSLILSFSFVRSVYAFPIPGLSSILMTALGLAPYGGQTLAAIQCGCSGGMLYVVHDYRTKLVLPVYQDALTLYHTPQNAAGLLVPGNYQLGNLFGPTVCMMGAPPLCIPIPAYRIKNFGNGGLNVEGAAAAINPLAWTALAATIGAAGLAILLADGDDGTAEGSPGCNATLESLSLKGDGENGPVWLHVETPGRTSWPQIDIGEKSDEETEYGYRWGGAISGSSESETVQFSGDGIKKVNVTVGDALGNTVTRECPLVYVDSQASTINPDSDQLNVSCTVSKQQAAVGESVSYSVKAYGGSGNYTYQWDGDITGAVTTYIEPTSSYLDTFYGTNSTTVNFSRPGVKIAKVTLTDTNPEEGDPKEVVRYCAPVEVYSSSEDAVCEPGLLSARCWAEKRSVSPGEKITYTARGMGGMPGGEEITLVNAELLINGHRVDWMRPCQNDKNLVNMFDGYDWWGSAGNMPEPGDIVEVTLRSVDGRYELTGEIEWPESGETSGTPTYDSCEGSGEPTDGGLTCEGYAIPEAGTQTTCVDNYNQGSATAGYPPIGNETAVTTASNGEKITFKVCSPGIRNTTGGVDYEPVEGVVRPVEYQWGDTIPSHSEFEGMGSCARMERKYGNHPHGYHWMWISTGKWELVKDGIPSSYSSNSSTVENTSDSADWLYDWVEDPVAYDGVNETTTEENITNDNNSNDNSTNTSINYSAINNHKASFLFDNAGTRVMNLLSPKLSASGAQSMVAKSKANGDDTIYLYLINQGDGPYVPQSFYVNDQIGGEIDQQKLAGYRARLSALKQLGYKIIFWLRADDSASMMSQSISNYKKYHQDVVANFDSYAAGYVIGLESNEYMDAGTERALIADMKSRTSKTVGVHLGASSSYDARARDSGADVYYKQYGWVSCSKVASMTASAISTVSPMKVVAAEYDKDSDNGCGAAALQAGAIGYGNG